MGLGSDLAGWLLMTLWIGALVVMVWLVLRGSGRRTMSDDAFASLRDRLARGEISHEEFDRTRAALLEDTLERERKAQ
jgi:uncharacterized membrane protein